MKIKLLTCAALATVLVPAAALADNPNDPSMRSAAAKARDRAATRQLNLDALARFRACDASGSEGWRVARDGEGRGNAEYAARSQDYRRAMAAYARDRAQYDRDMAAWRRSVDACRAGNYAACGN